MNDRRTHGRGLIIAVVIIGLIAATVTRQWAGVMRGSQHLAASTPLSRLNSYALALLLGGLRGPLVMFLWPSSEGQKSEKNLEDFDTKVEWIRLLQAEFDTVHIFQIWNKAYNISVLMANLPNKYATILDALDYAREVDAERPGNINILSAIAGIYGDKLGNSAEKDYYKRRVREETRAREALVRITFPQKLRDPFTELASRAGASISELPFTTNDDGTVAVTVRKSIAEQIRPHFQGDAIEYEQRQRAAMGRQVTGFRRIELDPMLDEKGNILPELLRAQPARAIGGNTGAELQYLAPFQPFPYGISAQALAYNYHKRAQVLLREAKQHHAQLSDLVVDSRPAISLRNWSEDEWERALTGELEAFGQEIPPQPETTEKRIRMGPVTQDLPLDARPINPTALRQAIFEYERSAQLAEDAIKEYESHLAEYKTNFSTYAAHEDNLRAHAALTRGDAAYLRLMPGGAGDGASRQAIVADAIEHYTQAAHRFRLQLLKYYVEPHQGAMFPGGRRVDPTTLTPQQVRETVEKIYDEIRPRGHQAQHSDDWIEYMTYIRRAETRLDALGARKG
jgi:type II secretory pathway pseudopilin PulG